MMNLRKASALLLVSAMMMSGLVAFSAPVLADQEVSLDFALNYENAWQEPGTEPPSPSTELIYNWDDVTDGGQPYWLGSTDALMQIGIVNLEAGPNDPFIQMNDTEVSLSCPDGAILNIVGDDTGTDSTDEIGVVQAASTVNARFYFDISPTATLGLHRIEIDVDYEKDSTSDSDTGEAWIYISSVFDDTSTPDSHNELPDFEETTATETTDFGRFEAGDTFVEGGLLLHNYATDITDVVVTFTPPTDGEPDYIDVVGNNFDCEIPDGIHGPYDASGAPYIQTAIWRLNIADGTPPDEYDCLAEITYHRNGEDVTEGVRDIFMEVDFGFRNQYPVPNDQPYSEKQCVATSVTITDTGEGNGTKQVDVTNLPYDTYEQSTFSDKKITIEVVVENNGNTPIWNAEFKLDPGNIVATPWDYFRNPRFFWDELNGAPPAASYDSIGIYGVDLDIGESITFVIEVIVVKEVPIGEHRLPILYDGFYFNTGSLGEPTGYYPIAGGDGVVNVPTADDLEVLFSIVVTDGYLDCHATPIAFIGDKEDITSETILVNIVNDEGYNFIDVVATADFTGTPFYAPLIDPVTLDWPLPATRIYLVDAQNANLFTPWEAWDAAGTMGLNFLVDTDPNMVPDRYAFSVVITAVIKETLQSVTTTVIVGVEIEYEGYGAMPVITAFTADEIVPGQAFDLVLTIENVGDDTLRDVWVEIPPDGTYEYPWDIEADFKEQFDWSNVYSEWFDVTGPIEVQEGMFYTVEDLDVDNIREIIEINLYMEGVYSNPGSTINIIHIIDLAPAASFQVTFEMFADKDLVNGKPYNVNVTVTGIGSNWDGTDAGRISRTQTLEVWSSLPGDSYNPVELDWFDAGLRLLMLVLFFIIVLAILLWVYNKFKGEPEDEEEDDFDFEDDEPASFEEPPAPAEKAPEELVQP